MLGHMSERERLGLYTLVAVVLLVLGYFGSSALTPNRPVTVVQEPDAAERSDTSSRELPKSTAAVEASPASPEVVVHVAGAVKNPRLARLKTGARVEDAIEAAGGSAEDADLESVNLAAKLEDGSQVFVPRKGKPDEARKVSSGYQGGATASPYASARAATPSNRSGTKKEPSGPIDLNRASLEQLQSLPGVGPSTALKILEYRKEHGSFGAIEEIMAVKGIGPKKFEKMRRWLKL